MRKYRSDYLNSINIMILLKYIIKSMKRYKRNYKIIH